MNGAPVVALTIVAVVVLGTIGLALFGVRRVKMDPQQYIVGGRSFGTVFLWVLLAGEIYTSFTFLGMAGWAYGLGAPAYYIFAYGTCAFVIGYFLLPAIWRIGKERLLLTGADFFQDRYGSRALGVMVAVVQFVMIVPYVTLQLSGLQLLLRIAGYGAFDATIAVCVAFILVALFVFTAGLRGTAWASIVKDALVLGAVAFAGIAIPIQFFGSPAKMIDQVLRVHPHALTLVAGTAEHGTVWYVSTVLLTAIGFYMGPHGMSAVYSARSENALRRNAMLLPLYQIVMLLVFFAGLAALLIVPGLKGAAVDQSFLLVVQRYYPPWVMGFVAAAGSLAALVPASAQLLGAASVFSKNVLGTFGIATGDAARMLATRVLVLVVALLALGFWLEEQKTIVELLLIYYNGITQFMPGIAAVFLWPRANVWGVAAGIAVGFILAIAFAAANVTLWGVNVGFAALLGNVIVMVVVSLLTPVRKAPAAII
ncbi:MAG: sodium:solute symporter family protein [Candidatus Tumulicola sp.]